MRERAESMGLKVVAVHVDNNRSAWQRGRSRPGWDAMLREIEAGQYSHVLAYDPDRLMRQPRDLEDLLDVARSHGVTLVGKVNDMDLATSSDQMVLRILIAQACKASDDTSRRVLDSLAEVAAAGRPHGGKRPFGFDADRVSHHPEEAPIVREIARRRLNGDSNNAIADDLNDRGVLTAQGRDRVERAMASGKPRPTELPIWRPVTIRALLESPRIAGLRTHRGEVVDAVWHPIIELSQWQELKTVQSQRTATWREGKDAWRFYWLRGVIRCECGRKLYGHKTRTPVYYCPPEQDGCGNTRISATAVEALIDQWITRRLASASTLATTTLVTVDPDEERERRRLDAKLQDLEEMWADGELTRAEYSRMRRGVQERVKKLSNTTVVRPTSALNGMTGAKAAELWSSASPPRRRAIAGILIADIIVAPSSRLGVFDPDRVRLVPAKL
jgi:site-specific DNA recombinase